MRDIERFTTRMGSDVEIKVTELNGKWVMFAVDPASGKTLNGIEVAVDIDLSPFETIDEFTESELASKLVLSIMRLAETSLSL